MLSRPAMLILTGFAVAQPVRAGEAEPSQQGSRSVVEFCCDFSHHPAMANVKSSLHGCDVSVAHDRHPHLRLLGPGSRLSLRFTLPEKPKAGTLEAVHLASAGADGEGVAPVTVSVNGRPVVRDWNVGATMFTETRWPVGDLLRPGENEIEWTAGKIQTHYWLRAVRLYAEFDRAIEVTFPPMPVGDGLFLETRFSQCSYNALATVLDHFYGVEGWANDRTAFEDWREPERRRHLLRLWLAPEKARPLPPVFAERYGSVVPGQRGGIEVPGTRYTIPWEPEDASTPS